jgi:hypothetical protein
MRGGGNDGKREDIQDQQGIGQIRIYARVDFSFSSVEAGDSDI